MIIKGLQTRSKSSINRIVRHLQNGDDNETIAFLKSNATYIRDMRRDAIAKKVGCSVQDWEVTAA